MSTDPCELAPPCDARTPRQAYVTLFIGVLDVSRQVLRWLNAGHNTQYLVGEGGRVVALERELDALFAKGRPTPAEVERLSVAIGEAQGRLRAEHLRTHLDTTALLTPAQVDQYVKARGY